MPLLDSLKRIDAGMWVMIVFTLVVLGGIIVGIVQYVANKVDGTRYNGTAAPGDYWTLTHDKDANTLTVQNHTAGAEAVTLNYRTEADDSHTIIDAQGEERNDYVRFVELKGYMLVLHTRMAGASGDQEALVIGVQSETLKITMTDNPHLFYQFSHMGANVSAGGVTFLRGRNASSDSAQAASTAAFGDQDEPYQLGRVQPFSVDPMYWNYPSGSQADDGTHTYLDDGGMAINFLPALQTPRNHMTMNEYDNEGELRGMTTIFGTEAGHFVVDTPNSSILCFDATKTVTDPAVLAGSYTVLFDATVDATLNQHHQQEGGTRSCSKASIVIVNDDGNMTLHFGGTTAFPDSVLSVDTFENVYGSVLLPNRNAMTPAPSLSGLFVASTGTRRQSGVASLVFSVLHDTIVFQSFVLSDASNIQFSYSFGAGVRDL